MLTPSPPLSGSGPASHRAGCVFDGGEGTRRPGAGPGVSLFPQEYFSLTASSEGRPPSPQPALTLSLIQLHRTFTHSIPLLVLATAAALWGARRLAPLASGLARPVPASVSGWQACVRALSRPGHCEAWMSLTAAYLLGLLGGSLTHVLSDIFYVVPGARPWELRSAAV